MHVESTAQLDNEAGISAIEFAILAPLLLTVLAAIVNLGLLLSAKVTLENKVYTASNYAMFTGQGEEPLSVFKSKIEKILENNTAKSLITSSYKSTVDFFADPGSQQVCEGDSTDCAVFMKIDVSTSINALPMPNFVIKEISANAYVRIK